MKLKLACSDFTFPLLSHNHVLDLIAMLGIPGVDIGIFGGRSHIRPDHVLRDIGGTARRLSKNLRDRGLKLADIMLIPGDFKTLAPNHPDATERAKSRAQFCSILEFATKCGSPHLSGLPGIHWEEESRYDSLRRSSEEIAWRVERARQAGVIFAIEAHVGSLVPTPPAVEHFLKMTPGLTLTLDYAHFTYYGIPDAKIEPLVQYASHFHARCAAKTRPQVRLKENKIDFPRVLRAMQRSNFRGYVSLEYVWIDWEHCNEVDNLSETIQLRDLLRSVKL